MISTCHHCGSSFTVKARCVGAYCSKTCMDTHRREKKPDWVQCSRCLAAIGLGKQKASEILKVASKSSILRHWRKEGIRQAKPKKAYRYIPNAKWWLDDSVASAWMSEYKPRFFDWSRVWHNHKSNLTYHTLSSDAKTKRNARTYKRNLSKYKNDAEFREKQLSYQREWRAKNKESHRASNRKSVAKRKVIDPGFKVQCNLRHRFKDIIRKAKAGGTHHSNNLTGCSTKQLSAHLESQFTRGMTWANYGTKWHVDHIIPCAAWDHTDQKQIRLCWHWSNLRPLCAKKNMDKGATITEPQMSLPLCAVF